MYVNAKYEDFVNRVTYARACGGVLVRERFDPSRTLDPHGLGILCNYTNLQTMNYKTRSRSFMCSVACVGSRKRGGRGDGGGQA